MVWGDLHLGFQDGPRAGPSGDSGLPRVRAMKHDLALFLRWYPGEVFFSRV